MLAIPISFQKIWWNPAPGKTCPGDYRHFLLKEWSRHYQIVTKEEEKKKVINQLLFKNKILRSAIKSCNWLDFEFGGCSCRSWKWPHEFSSSAERCLYPSGCTPWTPHWLPVPARPFLLFKPRLYRLPHCTDAAQIYCKRKKTHRGSNETLEIHTKGS